MCCDPNLHYCFSKESTCNEVVSVILKKYRLVMFKNYSVNPFNSRESKDCGKYCLYEEVLQKKYSRKLEGEEMLVRKMEKWQKIMPDKYLSIRLKINPNYQG